LCVFVRTGRYRALNISRSENLRARVTRGRSLWHFRFAAPSHHPTDVSGSISRRLFRDGCSRENIFNPGSPSLPYLYGDRSLGKPTAPETTASPLDVFAARNRLDLCQSSCDDYKRETLQDTSVSLIPLHVGEPRKSSASVRLSDIDRASVSLHVYQTRS